MAGEDSLKQEGLQELCKNQQRESFKLRFTILIIWMFPFVHKEYFLSVKAQIYNSKNVFSIFSDRLHFPRQVRTFENN